jgi:transcriptional regulator with XRE-family HTH domain
MPIDERVAAIAARFPAKLKELRAAAGLTQKSLAQAAGVTQGLISSYEAGTFTPAWDTVLALADALGVPVGAFAAVPTPPAKDRDSD